MYDIHTGVIVNKIRNCLIQLICHILKKIYITGLLEEVYEDDLMIQSVRLETKEKHFNSEVTTLWNDFS